MLTASQVGATVDIARAIGLFGHGLLLLDEFVDEFSKVVVRQALEQHGSNEAAASSAAVEVFIRHCLASEGEARTRI